MIKKYTAQEIEARMTFLGMSILNFHLVGVRSHESVPDKFDDSFYILENHNAGFPFACTTNPGKDYLFTPMNPKGTAVLVADKQYVNCFVLGLHKDKEALIQHGDLLVYRDDDRDIYAEELGKIEIAKPECRINIHRANNKWTSIFVGKWSAGCQVIANPENFQILLKKSKASAKGLFTYTLLNEW